jgi:hypothetical protein
MTEREDRTGQGPGPTERRLTVSEAATVLETTPEAVRGRIRRGTLRAEREAGRVYVVLDADQVRSTADQAPGQSSAPASLEAELRDRLRYVERQLEAERQAHAEARRLLAAALERIPPQIEPPSEPSEAPSEATEQPGRVGPQAPLEEAQEGTERPSTRRWWEFWR